MSAGNDGEDTTGGNPGGFALVGRAFGQRRADHRRRASDANGQMASFSNRAGTGAIYYLTALGVQVRTINENGQAVLASGTSFSAPVISGAAALLASAFPNLTGAQIVQLLLSTGDDAGSPGRDSVFGNGILNIARAFQPQGQTTLAGSVVPVSMTDNGQASSSMGDAKGQTGGAIILDGYSRAYAIELAAHAVARAAGAAAGAGAGRRFPHRRQRCRPARGVDHARPQAFGPALGRHGTDRHDL